MNEQTKLNLVAAADTLATIESSKQTSPYREHCGKDFVPRARSGGKRQRFCSRECRVGSHAVDRMNDEEKRSQPKSTEIREEEAEDEEEAPTKAPAVVPAKPSTGVDYVADDYEWNAKEVVFEEQRRTAIYWNIHDDLVIRQLGAAYENDPYVVICQNNLQGFIDRLCDMAGIASARPRAGK